MFVRAFRVKRMTSAAAEVMMSVELSGRKNIYMKLFLSV